MKLAISNLAWEREEEAEVAAIMQAHGVTGVEIAPTKVWPQPLEASDDDIRQYVAFWRDFGIQSVAFQSLLFGQTDVRIFGTADQRAKTARHLAGIAELAGKMGAGPLIFGSPAVRAIGEMPLAQAMPIGAEFFREAGDVAWRHGACICIEPNPPAYGCDFIHTAAEGRELVQAANSEGFRLHLDAGALTMNGEDVERELEASLPWLAHFHASEPNLVPVGQGESDHKRFGRALRSLGYPGWVSVEMRGGPASTNAEAVARALDVLVDCYG